MSSAEICTQMLSVKGEADFSESVSPKRILFVRSLCVYVFCFRRTAPCVAIICNKILIRCLKMVVYHDSGLSLESPY